LGWCHGSDTVFAGSGLYLNVPSMTDKQEKYCVHRWSVGLPVRVHTTITIKLELQNTS